MRTIIVISSLVFFSNVAFAQTDTSGAFGFDYRIYDRRLQKCCGHLAKPGEKVPDNHPNARFLNDTSLWEWREVDFGFGEPQEIYDVKPQYKDTLMRRDGSVIEVPVWSKDTHWKKPEPPPVP